MIRRPPRSTLFPTRRSSDLLDGDRRVRLVPHVVIGRERQRRVAELRLARELRLRHVRSEEHTSELQSQSNLVCRLLLEKKKQLRLHVTIHHEHRRPPLTCRA